MLFSSAWRCAKLWCAHPKVMAFLGPPRLARTRAAGVLEEERERREAEFEEALRARAVRSDLLGRDRAFRRYWWLQGAPALCLPPTTPHDTASGQAKGRPAHVLALSFLPGTVRAPAPPT